MPKEYLLLVAETKEGLQDLAVNKWPGWKIINNMVISFDQLSNDDDHSFGDLGDIWTSKPGFLALAYRIT